jgi:ATP-dependent DNA helicase RecG
MSITVEQLGELLNAQEGERLEFKEARTGYHFEELAKYCAALANEGGGRIILGITDKRPRKVVGSQAFPQPERTRAGLMENIPLRIECNELQHPAGRVLVFEVPSRPVGTPIRYRGYWMRRGDSLVEMPPERLREIFAEVGHDFSADVCPHLIVGDLSAEAMENFRRRWMGKTKNQGLATLSHEQLLRDIDAFSGNRLTYAALILFGTRQAVRKHLQQAEVIFEYRSSEASGPAQQRKEYQEGFFNYYDELWNVINLRNDLQHYQDGLFVLDIPTFSERPVREAFLNAVSHRDYQLGGSVFVRQYQRRLVLESPGGLPVDVTLDNILDRQSPRNRRIAEIFAKCGLVERSGQGMNLMFEQSIQQGKPVPDLAGTDPFRVVVTLRGEIEDPRFIRFLEKIGQERLQSFSTHDFLVLDHIHREQPIPPVLRPRIQFLRAQGVIEAAGRGRGTRYLLSRRYYEMIGRKGLFTLKRGLDRRANIELLFQHISDYAATGTRLGDMMQVFPDLSQGQVQRMLRNLKAQGRVFKKGRTRAALWFPIASDDSDNAQLGTRE